MKKILLATVLAVFTVSAFAQKFDKVQTAFLLGQIENAKKELDKNLADAKYQSLPETYLWKAKIYAELASNDKTKAAYPNGLAESYEAFKKYRQLDPEYKVMKAENNYRFLSLIYVDAQTRGIQIYNVAQDNAEKKIKDDTSWAKAFEALAVAEELGDFFSKSKLTSVTQNVDTFSLAYAASAAQQAGKTEEALKYYQKFADDKIPSKDYMFVYRNLLAIYSDKKDKDNFFKYLAQVKQLYPSNADLWKRYEAEFNSANLSLAEQIGKYNESVKADNLDADDYVEYAQTFYNAMLKETDKAKKEEYRKLALQAYGKAFEKGGNGVMAYNAGAVALVSYEGLDDEYRQYIGQAADLKAKREAVEKLQQAAADEVIAWMEKAYTALKSKTSMENAEKQSIKRAINALATVYDWKRNKARGKDPKAFDAYDAKYKQYDAEFNKY